MGLNLNLKLTQQFHVDAEKEERESRILQHHTHRRDLGSDLCPPSPLSLELALEKGR